MNVLSRRPVAGCLDRLWELHCAIIGDKQRFLRHEERLAAAYEDSFGALLSCLRLDPTWLAGAVRKAEPAEPVHELAYLLGNLPDQEVLWQDCKPFLFQKVSRNHERSLAANIFRHRDKDEAQWLIDRVDRTDDLLGPWALRALCRIDPDAAVRELPRLPVNAWGPTSRWCFAEIMRERPIEARVCVLRMLQDADAVQVVTVYQDDPGSMDVATLDALLDHLSTVLRLELAADAPGSGPFNLICIVLSKMSRLDHLERFERRQRSLLEARLTAWLLLRGPIPGQFARPDQEYAMQVLEKIGGAGYTRIVNLYLNSTNFYARMEALKDAVRRPDWQTVALLLYLAQKEEAHEAGPVEQGYATLALASIEEYASVIQSAVRWGASTLNRVTELLAELPIPDGALTPALNALKDDGPRALGAILALGGSRMSARRLEMIGRVHSVLRDAPRDSAVAHACVMTLRRLNDRSEEGINLVAPQVDVPAHRHDALMFLTQARTDAALDVLLVHLQKCYEQALGSHLGKAENPLLGSDLIQSYEHRLAIYLLNQSRTSSAVGALIRRTLEAEEPIKRKELMVTLLRDVDDVRSLEQIIDDTSAREVLHEAAFADEAVVVWFAGSKAAAISALARFDAGAAAEAARTAIENPRAHERYRYPGLLAEIDPLGSAPFLLERMRVDKDRRVRCAIGRAMVRVWKVPAAGLPGRLTDWLSSTDYTRRMAACESMGWLYPLVQPQDARLGARLEDVNERVSERAAEALSRLRDTEHTWEIAKVITAEADERRRWRLLDALIALGDPGEEYEEAPDWCSQVWQILGPAMRRYLQAELERGRQELARQAVRG
jgi:hypothetical protein